MPRKRVTRAVKKPESSKDEVDQTESVDECPQKDPQIGENKIREKVFDAFQKCQQPRYNLNKLAELLKAYYEQISKDETTLAEFITAFKHCVECGLQTKNRDSAAEKFMQFISIFSVLFSDVSESESEDEEDENLYNSLLKLLVQEKYHCNKNKTIRFRVCQLVRLLLGAAPTNASLDDEVASLCTNMLLHRIDDKVPAVRAQAARALVRLQQPLMKNCPVIAAYLFHMSSDESASVRSAVLSCISFTVKTLPPILERVRDVTENIRKLTYETIAQKVSVSALSNHKRLYLIVQGLSDSSEAVRKTVQTLLLQRWLTEVKDDMVGLLKLLDIVGAYETSRSAILALMHSQQLSAAKKFKLLDSTNVIPIDVVSAESIAYWHILCEFLRNKGPDGAALVDDLLPSTFLYAEYMESYFEKYLTPFLLHGDEELQKEEIEDDRIEKEFVAEQMFKMANSLDYSDSAGRKKMDEVVTKIINKVDILVLPNLFPALAKLYVTIHHSRKETESIEDVARMISELRMPSTSTVEDVDSVMMNAGDGDMRPNQVNEPKLRDLRLKKGELVVKGHKLHDEMDLLIAEKKYSLADDCQKEIDDLKAECKLIEAQILSLNSGSVCRDKKDILSNVASSQQEQEVEKNDQSTIIKCLRLVTELASEMFVVRCSTANSTRRALTNDIHSTFLGWIDSIVLPCFYNPMPAVRQEAVRALGTCCIYSSKLASKNFYLFMKAAEVDIYMVRTEAINALCDFIRFFGCKALLKESQQESGEEYDDESCKRMLMDKFLEMMNDEESEVREAAVNLLVRVHISHQIVSPMVSCRLILHWFNPVTKNDPAIIDLISKFLDTFPNMTQDAHECMQAAFLPTLRTLFDAPSSSPYASVKINNVVDLFLTITRPCLIKEALGKSLQKKNWLKEGSAHDNFAVMIANEVLAEPTSPHVVSLCRALPSLELDMELKDNIKDLHVLCDNLLPVVRDRTAIRYIKEFHRKLPKVELPDPTPAAEDDKSFFVNPEDVAISASPALRKQSNNSADTSRFDSSVSTQQSSTSTARSSMRATPRKKKRGPFNASPVRKTPGQIFLRPRSFETSRKEDKVPLTPLKSQDVNQHAASL